MPEASKARESLRLGLAMLREPSAVLWRLKYEGRGRMSVAVLLIALSILMRIAWAYGTGFSFRGPMYRQTEYIRILDEVWTYLIVWVTWIFANWGVATLADGEGTLRDVAIASAYACMPLIVLTIPGIILSHVLTLQEIGLYRLVSLGSLLWTVYLVFLQVRTTHDYATGKAGWVMVLSVLGMLFLWSLAILLYLMVGQIGLFVRNVLEEIRLRGGF